MKKYIRKTINRKGCMPCEICLKKEILVVHHIRGRDITKPNHPSNLVNICNNCHAGIHYGLIILEKWMMTSSGNKLFWHKKGEESFTGDDAVVNLLIPKDDSVHE